LTEEIHRQAGTFVAIKKKVLLRDCIRTFKPKYAKLALEVIENTIKAANKVAKFQGLEMQNLKKLTFSVYVLNPPEIIKDIFNISSITANRTFYG
jgi:AMMECR1 domain-containing protein